MYLKLWKVVVRMDKFTFVNLLGKLLSQIYRKLWSKKSKRSKKKSNVSSHLVFRLFK